mmetsp:Transcript_40246/g.103026  ORF Transcript_40246/g.103026 Transcript_40246/m.103026 type:complete len:223 (+) Transcript_40246:2590-3258(+)
MAGRLRGAAARHGQPPVALRVGPREAGAATALVGDQLRGKIRHPAGQGALDIRRGLCRGSRDESQDGERVDALVDMLQRGASQLADIRVAVCQLIGAGFHPGRKSGASAWRAGRGPRAQGCRRVLHDSHLALGRFRDGQAPGDCHEQHVRGERVPDGQHRRLGGVADGRLGVHHPQKRASHQPLQVGLHRFAAILCGLSPRLKGGNHHLVMRILCTVHDDRH